jgi:uncharacterized protein (TIGR03084 family)
VDIFDDLGAEQDRLETILASLDATAWATESGAPGWSITDVVLHLAQTEEGVVASVVTGDEIPPGGGWRIDGETVDAAVERRVRAEQAAASEVFERWRGARRAALAALRSADPNRRLTWVERPLKPATLATTRLAEHWAHGLDITEPLGVDFPDTARLRHVAWLGHATLPYAFALAGERFDEVFCELHAPDGSTWQFGDPRATSSIRGQAGEFCRVGARRLQSEDSSLVAAGPIGPMALTLLRNYAT